MATNQPTQFRLVHNNQLVLGQPDFWDEVAPTRALGLTFEDLDVQIFHNNDLVPWDVVDGSGVPDVKVTSGEVYFSGIPEAPGFYSFRFRPNTTGYWRAVLTYEDQVVFFDCDVVSRPDLTEGIRATFL